MSGISDPIADMLTRIRNALMARHEGLTLPSSHLKCKIAEILQAEGYITGHAKEEDSKQGLLHIQLKYLENEESAITALNRVSRPGRRVYVRAAKLARVRNGLGIAILSTSNGVMTDRDARQQGVGGEVLCEVW